MIELMHDAYNKDIMHVHEIGMKDQMIDGYWCAWVHGDMTKHVYEMSVE